MYVVSIFGTIVMVRTANNGLKFSGIDNPSMFEGYFITPADVAANDAAINPTPFQTV